MAPNSREGGSSFFDTLTPASPLAATSFSQKQQQRRRPSVVKGTTALSMTDEFGATWGGGGADLDAATIEADCALYRHAGRLKTQALEQSGFYEVEDALGELAMLRLENRILRMRCGEADEDWELLAEAMTTKDAARRKVLRRLFGRDIVEDNARLREKAKLHSAQLGNTEAQLEDEKEQKERLERRMKREGRRHDVLVKELEEEIKRLESARKCCIVS